MQKIKEVFQTTRGMKKNMATTLQDNTYLKTLHDYVKSGLICSAKQIENKADSIADDFIANNANRVYITIDIDREGNSDLRIETTYPAISEIIS